MRFTSYRGAIVTNMHFNAVSKLILDPWQPEPGQLRPGMPTPQPRPPNLADTRCQYWTGSVCGLRVRNNRFGCGALIRIEATTHAVGSESRLPRQI